MNYIICFHILFISITNTKQFDLGKTKKKKRKERINLLFFFLFHLKNHVGNQSALKMVKSWIQLFQRVVMPMNKVLHRMLVFEVKLKDGVH